MSGAALGSYSSIPAAWAVQNFYYQPRLFEQHNITVPQTWEEVIEVAEKYGGQDLVRACLFLFGILKNDKPWLSPCCDHKLWQCNGKRGEGRL